LIDLTLPNGVSDSTSYNFPFSGCNEQVMKR
jgi:hypothetical protein